MTGIGGDCFAIVVEPDGTVHGLNGSGRAAAASIPAGTAKRVFGNAGDRPACGDGARRDRCMGNAARPSRHAAASTPCSPTRYGWRRKASRYTRASAGTGRAGRRLARRRRRRAPLSRQRQGAGDRHAPASPALAATLRAIARAARRHFTKGVAAEIAATVNRLGGFLSEADLAAVSADWVDPSARYAGHDVLEIPPNGQGITALIMFAVCDDRDLGGSDPCRSNAARSRSRPAGSPIRCATIWSPTRQR